MNQSKKPSRYARQEILPQIGLTGQKKISDAIVAIVGLGALGSVTAELLARAGVGTILLIDRDVVERSNLQRQVLYAESDIGKSKVAAGQVRLQSVNGEIKIIPYAISLDARNISLLKNVKVIVDCTDNMYTRFVLNDYCRKNKIPLIYGSAIQTSGYVMSVLPTGPCLRCFLSDVNLETCESAGVLNTATSAIASLQVTHTLRVITQSIKKEEIGKLSYINVWDTTLQSLVINQRKDCPTCNKKYEYLTKVPDIRPIRFCSTGQFQVQGKPVNLKTIEQRWRKIGNPVNDSLSLHLNNITLFADGRALIRAESKQEALKIYTKYVGL
ncbi:HesA/MoeB/ThiF family protein [Candidatus Woesearchaeota archaeon]|nr:HesA/MoeB/ThiF family protein [Candidatus Woesearchaeota archaeon]